LHDRLSGRVVICVAAAVSVFVAAAAGWSIIGLESRPERGRVFR
jgi:hypothetical protein